MTKPSSKPPPGLHGLPVFFAALSAVAFAGAHAADETKAAPPPAAAGQLKPVAVTERMDAVATESGAAQSVGERNGRQVAESPAATLEDVVAQMANVSTTYGLTIRGISLFGPNGGNSKIATLSVDGVQQDNYGQDIGGLSVWDAARVEVLRGPQPTLPGRHALAGSVVLKTRDPTDAWEARGRAGAGDPRGRNLAVAGGGPLLGDMLAFRISAEDHRGTSGARNPTQGDDRWDRDDRQTLRGKLRFTLPGTGYRALLTLADQRRALGGSWVDATLHRPAERIALSDSPSASDNRYRSAALEQTWRNLGVDWTLSSSRGRLRDDRAEDYDRTELRQGASGGSHDDGLRSHELRGNFDVEAGGGRLSGVFGAYWARRDVDAKSDLSLPLAYVLTEIGSCPDRARCDALYPADAVSSRHKVMLAFTNQALFTELDYRVGPLTLVAGLRYDKESQRRLIASATTGNSPAAAAAIDALKGAGVTAPDGQQSRHADFTALLPKLGLRYRIHPRWTAGFTAQRGYRAGGVNFNGQLGPQDFDSEFTNNYEASLKGLVADDLLLTLNAYRIDWRRQQVDVGTNDLSVLIVNAGRSRLQGLELELRGRVHRELEVFGAFGASRTRFLQFTSVSGDFAGKEFTLSPRQTWSLGGTWKPAAGAALHASVSHEGRTYGNPANDAERSNPSRTLLNAKFSHALAPRARWFLAGFNLLDKDYTVWRSETAPNRQVAQLGRGRTLYAGFEAEF